MADQKISQLDLLAGSVIATGDWVPVVDVSDTTMAPTGTTKRIDADLIKQVVNAGTAIWYGNGYTPRLSDAVRYGGNIVHVEAYGASPSASAADNAVAIQAAITAAANDAIVLFGPGTYQFDTALQVYNGTILRGQGRTVTTLQYTGAASAIISQDTGAQRIYVCLEDFRLYTTTGAIGIDIANLKYSTIRRVRVMGFSQVGIKLNALSEGCWSNVLDEIYVSCGVVGTPSGTAVLLTGSSHAANQNVISGVMTYNAVGVHVAKGNGNEIINSDIEQNTVGYRETAVLSVAGEPYTVDNAVAHCRLERNDTPVEVVNTTGIATNLHFSDNWITRDQATNRAGDVVCAVQFLANGDFENADWDAGWSNTASPARVQGTADDQIFQGTSSCMLPGTGALNGIQHLIRGYTWLKGKTVTMSAFVKGTIPAYLTLADGVNTTNGQAHTGGGDWERLVVRHRVSTAATSLYARVYVPATHSGTVCIDGCELRQGYLF